MDPYFQQFRYGNEYSDYVPGQVKHICRECGSPDHPAAICHLLRKTSQFSPEHQYAQNQQQAIYDPAPNTYSHDWGNFSTQYHQPQQFSIQYEYSQPQQQERYNSWANTYNTSGMDHSDFRYGNTQQQYIPDPPQHYSPDCMDHQNFEYRNEQCVEQAFPTFQLRFQEGPVFNEPQQFQQIESCSWGTFQNSSTEVPAHNQLDIPAQELEGLCKTYLQQMLQQQVRMQNCQILLDQMNSSFNQMLAQRSNDIPIDDVIYEEMDCRACDSLDIGSKALHDSSRFLCDDAIVRNDFDSECNTLVDSVDVVDCIIADDGSVGTCTEEAMPQELFPFIMYPLELEQEPSNVEENLVSVGGCSLEASSLESPFDVSVGDCMEAILQESLPLVVELIESKQEPSSVEEEKVVEPHDLQLESICNHSSLCRASSTSYSPIVSIYAHHSENVIEGILLRRCWREILSTTPQ